MIKVQDGIALLSGNVFDYNNPEESVVTIDDIATALANVCRFAGHLHYFYSVAQHAVNASLIVPEQYAFDALMHDTAEAFTNDLPTPLKLAFPVFKELEVRIETAMSQKFGFQYPLGPEVKLADLQMLKLEKEKIKRDKSRWEMLDNINTDHLVDVVDLRLHTPPQARRLFLDRYWEIVNNDERYAFLREKAAA
jgi:hypothetical protein